MRCPRIKIMEREREPQKLNHQPQFHIRSHRGSRRWAYLKIHIHRTAEEEDGLTQAPIKITHIIRTRREVRTSGYLKVILIRWAIRNSSFLFLC